MVIKRDYYLNKLIKKKGNGLIKIVTGIRRSGKSYLLFTIFHNHLLDSGVDENHIIEVALDDRTNIALRDPDAMLAYVKSKIVDNGQYYIILDEVQLMREFEDVLNSFLHIRNADVYVTGSNSKFLSSDVITEFRGRGDEIRVYPLSFAEFYSVYDGTQDEAWDDYFNYGGLPLVLSYDTPALKSEYLASLFKTVYLSDLIEHHHIRNQEEFDELIDILASSIGSFTNPLKLANTFKSVKNKTISDITLKKYLKFLEDSFLISKAKRYDLKGKKYINSPAKYYFEDMGLRNVRLNFRQTEENHIMENIVYNELRKRGFTVDVGLIEAFSKDDNGTTLKRQLEVDFVASQGSKKYYIQSAFKMSDPDKREQEERSLRKIDDSFKKIIIVRDNIKPRLNDYGITTVGIINFLLNENSLDV
jgi:hypothetical protein